MLEMTARTAHTSHTKDERAHAEGAVARTIEEKAARLRSELFPGAGPASIGASLPLQCSGRKEESLFVGQRAPTFLVVGLYNEPVNVAGSDRAGHAR